MKTIVVDLDGTLCNCDHRIHLAQAKDWDSFQELAPQDTLYDDVSGLIKSLSPFYQIVVITGRNDRYRAKTIEWLRKHDMLEHIDSLIMRPDGDRRKDREYKISAVADCFGTIDDAKEEVFFCLEDRDSVVEALRGVGLNVWQVRQGGY